jgi:hypothetical protein
MRNTPLRGLMNKKSPLEINPNYDDWYYNPKTQLKIDKKKKKANSKSSTQPSHKSLGDLVTKSREKKGA